mgnify:CR=1 FL=1
MEFEAKAAKGLDHKALVSYDISLERLKMAGYERHASPAEAFSLLIDNLEGKLKGKYKAVAEDMLDDSGEWMSMAVERKGNTLICYLHPEGLAWDKEKKIYMHDGFNHSGMQECAISGKESTMWRPLDQFGNDFVKLLYGRSYNDLPEEMKEDISCAVNVCKTQVYLPPEDGNIWPVYRSNNNPLCVVCYKADGGASRGVREKPVVSAKKPNARQNNPAMPTSTLPGSFRAEHHLRG